MPRRKSQLSPASPHDALRREIAALAARMMAEDGVDDYGYAKRKAARQLGAAAHEALPGNEEVAAALRDYLAIYQEEEAPQRLRELRLTALEVMRRFAEFRPWLTGAVLEGVAGRHAGIEIDLYADTSKDAEIMLLSSNIPFDTADNAQKHPGSPETTLTLDWGAVPVRLRVYPAAQERVRERDPHSGASPNRASIATLEKLLNQVSLDNVRSFAAN